MYVLLIQGESGPQLVDVDNLTELGVRVIMSRNERQLSTTAPISIRIGDINESHAWLDIEQLRQLAGVRSKDWEHRFGEMTSFARTRGWVNSDGTRVRAHVEREELQ